MIRNMRSTQNINICCGSVEPDPVPLTLALMIMGVSGGALLTPLMGLVADQFGQVTAFGLLGVCLVYIGWIAIRIKTK